MRKDILLNVMKKSLEDKIEIRRNVEMDRKFVTRVPIEVKRTFYDLYSYALELNYKMISDIKMTKGDEYKCEELYDKYTFIDDSFVDFAITLIENYDIKEDIFF